MAIRIRSAMWGLAVLAFISVSAPAQAKSADVAGTWKGTMETQIGPVENTITIEPGAALEGQVKVGEYEGRIAKGKREGDKISFEITIERGTLLYDGTVGADEMKLTVTGTTGNKMALVAKRQK